MDPNLQLMIHEDATHKKRRTFMRRLPPIGGNFLRWKTPIHHQTQNPIRAFVVTSRLIFRFLTLILLVWLSRLGFTTGVPFPASPGDKPRIPRMTATTGRPPQFISRPISLWNDLNVQSCSLPLVMVGIAPPNCRYVLY